MTISSFHREKLEKIYRKLPKLKCKGLCTASCSLIKLSPLERKIITQKVGDDPFIRDEQFLDYISKHSPEEGKCSVYSIRPLICRLWGLVKKMACPFGCVPERWLTDDEAAKYLTKAKYYVKREEM